MRWYVLNFVPAPGFRRDGLPDIIDRFNRLNGASLDLFAPTFISLTTDRGRVKRVERPLLYHYIFVRGDEEHVKQLCLTNRGFSFVIDRAAKTRRHLTLSDHTVRQFRIIARYYGNNLPYYPLSEVNLEEGDKVEVVDGPLAGLRGTYISRKGGKRGNILISVDHQLAAIVYDVRADYVRVLEFARDTRRAYDQIDAFTLHLLSILENGQEVEESRGQGVPASYPPRQSADVRADCKASSEATLRAGALDANNPKDKISAEFRPFSAACLQATFPRAQIQPLSEEPKNRRTEDPRASLAQLLIYTRRLGAVRLHNPKLDAKLQILLYAAYTLLGDAENAAKARDKYESLAHHITNPWTIALSHLLLPLPCGEGRGGASSSLVGRLGGASSPIQRAIARLLNDKLINN